MTKIIINLPPHNETRSLLQIIKKQLTDFFKKNALVTEVDVKLSHGSNITTDKVCEIYLKTTEKNIFTIQKGASFEASVVKAINKLQNQLNNINNNLA